MRNPKNPGKDLPHEGALIVNRVSSQILTVCVVGGTY